MQFQLPEKKRNHGNNLSYLQACSVVKRTYYLNQNHCRQERLQDRIKRRQTGTLGGRRCVCHNKPQVLWEVADGVATISHQGRIQEAIFGCVERSTPHLKGLHASVIVIYTYRCFSKITLSIPGRTYQPEIKSEKILLPRKKRQAVTAKTGPQPDC